MATGSRSISLSEDELREVARFAAACARDVLDIFEVAEPSDFRARAAIEAAEAFAQGARRGKALRDAAWAAMRAAHDARSPAGRDAARAAMSAASAAYLHPLAEADQVKHILGSAAHAARATELTGAEDANPSIDRAVDRATPKLVEVLQRFPEAPRGGGRVGELMRELDRRLRTTTSVRATRPTRSR